MVTSLLLNLTVVSTVVGLHLSLYAWSTGRCLCWCAVLWIVGLRALPLVTTDVYASRLFLGMVV